MKDRTTLSLRLTSEEREALEALKTYLNEPVATRALLTVIRLYPGQHQALQATLDELDRARAGPAPAAAGHSRRRTVEAGPD